MRSLLRQAVDKSNRDALPHGIALTPRCWAPALAFVGVSVATTPHLAAIHLIG